MVAQRLDHLVHLFLIIVHKLELLMLTSTVLFLDAENGSYLMGGSESFQGYHLEQELMMSLKNKGR